MSNDHSNSWANSRANNSANNPEFYRREARELLRALRSTHAERVALAAQRFAGLRSFAGKPLEELGETSRIRLKHALAVVAGEAGFESWTALLASYQANSEIKASLDVMYCSSMAAMMNRWFSDYREAEQSLTEMGGYLLPYGKQFYIAERGGIEALGLDPDDSDWQAIGFNWLRPVDYSAWLRIWGQRRAVIESLVCKLP